MVRACTTWFHWTTSVEENGNVHLVRMVGKWDPQENVDFSYACDCGSDQPCLHVLIVKGQHCGWRSATDPEEETERGRCPRCDAAVIEGEE